MKKFEGMLFCTDLDGTLYTGDKRVSKENLEAIEYFKSEGGLFTFITGRVPITAMDIYELIKPNAPFGCINGGGIYDGATRSYVWNTFLANGVEELVKMVDKELPEMGIQLNVKDKVYFNKDSSAMEHFRKVTGVPNISCPFEKLNEPLIKIVFGSDDPEQIDALSRLLKSHPRAKDFDFIRSERRLYEILPKGVSKGTLLKKMAELFGIKMENTIAAGDYNNDVAMVKIAGRSFAVSNAVEEVKAVADFITVSNEEDAIATIIYGIEKGIY